MDLIKILGHIENHEELIRQIEGELGKEYVPRSEFNAKNNDLKAAEKQLNELNESLSTVSSEKSVLEQSIDELTSKVTSSQIQALKSQIAYEKGLPFELALRLKGEDEESLREDAESLSQLVASNRPLPPLKSTEDTGGGEDEPYKKMLNQLKGE